MTQGKDVPTINLTVSTGRNQLDDLYPRTSLNETATSSADAPAPITSLSRVSPTEK